MRRSPIAGLILTVAVVMAPLPVLASRSIHLDHRREGKQAVPTGTTRLSRDPAIVVGQAVMIPADSAYYPRDALKRRVEGRGVVECTVTAAHAVTGCVALAFSPPGEGFDAGALQRIGALRVPAHDEMGDTAGRKVRFPTYFRLVKRGLGPSSLGSTGRTIGTAGVQPGGRH